jgi:hypothetical protein
MPVVSSAQTGEQAGQRPLSLKFIRKDSHDTLVGWVDLFPPHDQNII